MIGRIIYGVFSALCISARRSNLTGWKIALINTNLFWPINNAVCHACQHWCIEVGCATLPACSLPSTFSRISYPAPQRLYSLSANNIDTSACGIPSGSNNPMALTASQNDSSLGQRPVQPGYAYSPLPDHSFFRLFLLYPGEGSDVIRGTLIHVRLDVGHQYEAVSYHWEDKSGHYIEVDGCFLHTVRSTAVALQQVRRRDATRYIWIDAICINQEDALERSQQVSIMGRIYSGATQVLICICEHRKSRPKELLEYIQAAFEPVEQIPGYPTPKESFFMKGYSGLNGYLFGDAVLQLSFFLTNPWFSRVWVMQEVGLARRANLFCDDWSIPWDKVMFAVSFYNALGSAVKARYSLHLWRIFPLTKAFWKPNLRGDLLEVLIRTQDRKATDHRDKVFAVLSHPWALMSDEPVQPDYRKSVEQVLFEVACSQMKGPRPLRILSAIHHLISHPKRSIDDMSWVPQWRAKLPGYGYLFGTDTRFKCANGISAHFEIHPGPKMLSIWGCQFDTITYTRKALWAGCAKGSRDSTNLIPAIWAGLSEPEGGSLLYPDKKSSFWEAYLQTLTASNSLWYRSRRTSVLVPNNDLDETLHQARVSFSKLGIVGAIYNATNSLVEDLSIGEKGVLYIIEQALTACQCRSFFKSSRGYYGLGPEVAEVGDVICILFGSSVPFVLRPNGTSGQWKLVGECYVHGIMNGEGIQMWEQRLVREQNFQII